MVAVVFALSCGDRNSKAYEREGLVKFLKTPESKWVSELQKTGFGNEKNLKNTVLLVTHSTHCPNCLNELSIWNDIYQRQDRSFKIMLIVIEQHASRYQNFLERNNLSIQSYQDSTASLIKNEFIPYTPVKLYFDPSGSARRMHLIGADQAFNYFLEEIQSHNDQVSFLDNYM